MHVVLRLALARRSLVLGIAFAALGAAPAMASPHHGNGNGNGRGHNHNGRGSFHNAVYTETNDPSGNSVVVFKRHLDGTIAQEAVVSTGGNGLATQPPFGFPIVDSQGAIALAQRGNRPLLFAVNAGSNTISSFRVTRNGLKLVDVVDSGGTEPISITTSGHLLYVLNEHSGNISGFRITRNGHLRAIPSSSRSLSTPGPDSISSQIGFTPGGRVLTVTERCYVIPMSPFTGCSGQPKGVIDTFVMKRNGTPGPAQEHSSSDYGPFGFAYQTPHHLIVTNTGFIGSPPNPADPADFTGTASSYRVTRAGGVSPTGTVATDGRGACWIAITVNGRFGFVTNSLSAFPAGPGSGVHGIARLAIARNGTTRLLGTTDVTPDSHGPAFPTDVALSKGSQFLYVAVPTLNMGGAGNTSHIDVYRVGSDGSLTHIQATPDTLAGGISGIAAN